MRYPNITTIKAVQSVNCAFRQIRPNVWVPARPLGYMSLRNRLRAAWLVFTGRADALLWEGQ